MNHFKKAFCGKTVLITGHTGFKGSWLTTWLSMLGAKVVGISEKIPTVPSNYESVLSGLDIVDLRLDICDKTAICKAIDEHQPDFVFHLAAQALVRSSYEAPLQTLITNSIGTATVLEGLRGLTKPVVAIMITSDKAYDNVEWVWGYRETDRLGGKDPYSASKGMAELAIRSYVESFFNSPDSNVRIGITRAGNVIGGGDWAEDRIVPDCINAWSKGETVDIRSPKATRPWQHVLEPLSGYLYLATCLSENKSYNGEAYNFGPSADKSYSVSELINSMASYWELVKWNDTSNNSENFHEAGLLKLNCDKALFDLNWEPTLDFQDTVKITIEWYKHYYRNCEGKKAYSMHDFEKSQIQAYVKNAKSKGLMWAQ